MEEPKNVGGTIFDDEEDIEKRKKKEQETSDKELPAAIKRQIKDLE